MFDELKGMDFGKLGEMLQNVQNGATEIQKDIESKEFTAKGGGGLVKASINGNSELIDIDIDDSLMEDKESLQILLISVINDAIKMAEDNKKRAAMNMLGKMSSK